MGGLAREGLGRAGIRRRHLSRHTEDSKTVAAVDPAPSRGKATTQPGGLHAGTTIGGRVYCAIDPESDDELRDQDADYDREAFLVVRSQTSPTSEPPLGRQHHCLVKRSPCPVTCRSRATHCTSGSIPPAPPDGARHWPRSASNSPTPRRNTQAPT